MNAHAPTTALPGADASAGFSDGYVEVISLIESLHRLLLDAIKCGLENSGIHQLNPAQALLLLNMGPVEFSPRELTSRGYYLGSNASYNLKKLIELGYMESRRSEFDARSVRLSLTEKGMDVHFTVAALLQSQARELGSGDWLGQNGVLSMAGGLRTLRRYWAQAVC